jgi:hypothetical protein
MSVKERMMGILRAHGIEMKVGGCGCCGSPWVKFAHNGESIIDEDEADFDMSEYERATPTEDGCKA